MDTIRKTCYISNDLTNFDPKEYFEDNDYWNEILENVDDDTNINNIKSKIVSTKNYSLAKFVIRDSSKMKLPTRFFIVAEEIFTKEELKLLEPYCQCRICTASYFSLNRWFDCRCCFGCIKMGKRYASERLVKQARRLHEAKKN